MKKILLIFTLICMTACAYANEYGRRGPLLITEWERKGPVYVDVKSVVRTDDSAKGWSIRPNFVKSRIYNPKYTYDMAYVDARCKVNEMAILNTRWYNNRHELVYGLDVEPFVIEYIKVKPKTNNEVLFNALCPKPVKNNRRA